MRTSRVISVLILLLTFSIGLLPSAVPFSKPSDRMASASNHSPGKSDLGPASSAPFSDSKPGVISQNGEVSFKDLPSADPGYTGEASSKLAQPSAIPAPSIVSRSAGTGPRMGSEISGRVTQLAGFEGVSAPVGGGNPPDPQIAAGPTSVVEMTNFEIEIFTKQGVQLARHTFGQFFNNTRNPYGSMFDPKVLFDASSARWYVSVGDRSTDAVRIAVSATSDPLGHWKLYSLSTNGDFPDQPIIGVSDDKFIVSTDDYATEIFVGAQIWVIPKSQLVAGAGRIDFTTFGPMYGIEAIHPVHSLSPTTTLYMVTTGGSDIDNSEFHLYSVSGVPPGRVTIRTIPLSISPIFASVSAGQPGTAVQLDTGQSAGGPGDARIQSAAWFEGMLWLTFDDGCTPVGDTQTRSCFRLTEIDTTRSPIEVKQDFDVGAKGFDYFYPALSIDGSGDLAVIFGYSSTMSNSCCFASIGLTGQATTDPADTFRNPITVKAGNYSETGGNFLGTVRYGDYFGASVDPSNQSIIWVAGEYLTRSPLCGRLVSCWATHVDNARVQDAGFSLTTEQTYVKVRAGSYNSTTISLSSLGGFAGLVNLTASITPQGPTISWSSTHVNLTAGGSANSTLTITVEGSIVTESYIVEVTGISGAIKVSGRFFVSTVGFILSSDPPTLTLQAGSAGTLPVTATSINSFSGNIMLTVAVSPSGPTASFTSQNVMLANESVASSISIYAGGRSQGIYTVTVTGTSASETETIVLFLAVVPFSVSIDNSSEFKGAAISTVGRVTVDTSNPLTLSGVVKVVATDESTGVALIAKNYTLTGLQVAASLVGGLPQTSFVLNIPLSPYPISSEVVLAFLGNSTSVQVSITSDLANFRIRASPAEVSLIAKSEGACNVTLTSINDFAGRVNLSVSVATDGLNPSALLFKLALPTNTVRLAADGSAVLALRLTSQTAGDFSINITGTSGSLSSSAILTVHVTDIGILGLPVMTFIGGNPGSETILLTSINGFSGPLSLSTLISSSIPNAPTASINPTNVLLISGWTAALARVSSLNAPVGNYTLTTIASQGSVSQHYDTTLQVFDFSIAVTPSTIRVFPGNSTFVSAYGVAVNGYANDVSLTIIGLPSCVKSPLGNVTIVYVNRPGYPNSSMISLVIGANCPAQQAIVAVRAYDSSYRVIRTTSFTLVVSGHENPPPPSCDSPGTSDVQDECDSSSSVNSDHDGREPLETPAEENLQSRCDD